MVVSLGAGYEYHRRFPLQAILHTFRHGGSDKGDDVGFSDDRLLLHVLLPVV